MLGTGIVPRSTGIFLPEEGTLPLFQAMFLLFQGKMQPNEGKFLSNKAIFQRRKELFAGKGSKLPYYIGIFLQRAGLFPPFPVILPQIEGILLYKTAIVLPKEAKLLLNKESLLSWKANSSKKW